MSLCRAVEFDASCFDTAGLDVPETKARQLLDGRVWRSNTFTSVDFGYHKCEIEDGLAIKRF